MPATIRNRSFDQATVNVASLAILNKSPRFERIQTAVAFCNHVSTQTLVADQVVSVFHAGLEPSRLIKKAPELPETRSSPGYFLFFLDFVIDQPPSLFRLNSSPRLSN